MRTDNIEYLEECRIKVAKYKENNRPVSRMKLLDVEFFYTIFLGTVQTKLRLLTTSRRVNYDLVDILRRFLCFSRAKDSQQVRENIKSGSLGEPRALFFVLYWNRNAVTFAFAVNGFGRETSGS